ncbi:MAG: type II toxin-antitoxin system RelE family toxin [Nitrospiraceae bacterium]
MAWYRLAFRPEVVTDLATLDKGIAQRLFDKTKWLASNVENLRHESLAPELPSLSKYSVGDWRIFYSIDRDAGMVDIHCIALREDVLRQS